MSLKLIHCADFHIGASLSQLNTALAKKRSEEIRSSLTSVVGLCKEKEVLMMIKTRRDLYTKIKLVIESMHDYTVPEIIAVPIIDCSEEYLKWLIQETGK